MYIFCQDSYPRLPPNHSAVTLMSPSPERNGCEHSTQLLKPTERSIGSRRLLFDQLVVHTNVHSVHFLCSSIYFWCVFMFECTSIEPRLKSKLWQSTAVFYSSAVLEITNFMTSLSYVTRLRQPHELIVK